MSTELKTQKAKADPFELNEAQMLEIIRRAEEDIKMGRYKIFESAEDIKEYFESK